MDSRHTIGTFKPEHVVVEHWDECSAPALLWNRRGQKRRAPAVGDAAGEPEPPAPLPIEDEDVCDSDADDADGPHGDAEGHPQEVVQRV